MADIKVYGKLVNDTPEAVIADAAQIKADETRSQAQFNNTLVAAVAKTVGTISLEDINLESWDQQRKTNFCIGVSEEPSFYKVVDTQNHPVGTLLMFSDESIHQITQVFITNFLLYDGNSFVGHEDTQCHIYRRNLGDSSNTIYSGTHTWSEWTVQEVISDWNRTAFVPKGLVVSHNGVLYKALQSVSAGEENPCNNPKYLRLTQGGYQMVTEEEYDLAKDNDSLDENMLYLIEEEEE